MFKRFTSFLIGVIFIVTNIMAQEKALVASVSNDTILYDNYLELTFTIKNVEGKFEAPMFEDFEIIGGPNVSSSFHYINGQSSQERSYTYFLKPTREGSIYIAPAYLTTGEKGEESLPIEINVLPNPDGIIQEPKKRGQQEDFFGQWNLPNFSAPTIPTPNQEMKKETAKTKRKKRKI